MQILPPAQWGLGLSQATYRSVAGPGAGFLLSGKGRGGVTECEAMARFLLGIERACGGTERRCIRLSSEIMGLGGR